MWTILPDSRLICVCDDEGCECACRQDADGSWATANLMLERDKIQAR